MQFLWLEAEASNRTRSWVNVSLEPELMHKRIKALLAELALLMHIAHIVHCIWHCTL
jgi:hypothetical protein